jgi:acyl-CoA synthetase (AMP-forming)/AMP-acid ligase II
MGDIGYLDEDGYLFLTDRSADLIIWGGVNVYPAEVKAELLGHPPPTRPDQRPPRNVRTLYVQPGSPR